MRRLTWRGFLALFLLCVGATSSIAEEHAAERARRINEEGRVVYDLGEYTEAISRFTEAYKVYPDPRILFNLAQTYRRLHQYARAVELYRTVVRGVPPDAPDREAFTKFVEDIIRGLEKIIAAQDAVDSAPPHGTL